MPGRWGAAMLHPQRVTRARRYGRDRRRMAAPGGAPTTTGGGDSAPQPLAVMRSRAYLRLLVLAVVLGVPIAAAAFGFLKLTELLQHWAFGSAPQALGFATAPTWWPLLPLGVAGLVVGLTIRHLPG